jgi:hypothetical protein
VIDTSDMPHQKIEAFNRAFPETASALSEKDDLIVPKQLISGNTRVLLPKKNG